KEVSTAVIPLPTFSKGAAHMSFGSALFFGTHFKMNWKDGWMGWIYHKHRGVCLLRKEGSSCV
ncbi:hypothetical protein PJP13_29905, partial [Mycobacterium kansasii]